MNLEQMTAIIIIFTIIQIQVLYGNQEKSSCGRRLVNHETLVTHGLESNEGKWPWHAAIFHIEINWNIVYKCGGSVVTSSAILTAAHCVYQNGQAIIPDRVIIELGKHNLKISSANTQYFEAFKIIAHPNYRKLDESNDIAVIILATEATFNNYVQPICLWDSNKMDISEVIGRNGNVIGWGFTETDQISFILREAVMPVVSLTTCLLSNRDFFGSFLSDNNFCAGFRNGTSVCNGDSGGSITFEDDGVYSIRGIVSLTLARGNESLCNTKEYVIFTDVAKYLHWIEEVVPGVKGPGVKGPGVKAPEIKAPEVKAPEVKASEVKGPEVKGPGVKGPELKLESAAGYEGSLLPEPGVCGIYSNADVITKGQITKIDEFPWMALIDYSKPMNGRGFHCVGVLINNRYVLTAAHCVKAEAIREKGWRISSIRLGEWDRYSERDCEGETEEERKESNDCADPPLNIAVEEMIVNENYDSKSHAHDIALLRLSRSVNYSDFIKPICLPKSESLRTLDYEGINLEEAGWKKTEPAGKSNFKRKANFNGWSLERCNKTYNRLGVNLGSGQMCAGGINGTNSCVGDSGGPLMALDESNPTAPYYYLAGVVLFGPVKCGTEGIPEVYTRVSAYSDWILQNIRA